MARAPAKRRQTTATRRPARAGTTSEARDDGHERARQRSEGTEWVIGIAAGILVLAVILYLAADAITTRGDGPELLPRVVAIQRTGTQFTLTLEIENAGPSTASDVVLEGRLLTNGQPVETSSVTLDYVPGESRATATLGFVLDPAAHQVELVVRGYAEL